MAQHRTQEMLGVRIRRAARSDAPALATFAADVFRDTYATNTARADLDAQIARSFDATVQAAEIDAPDWCTLLADAGGELVGYAQLRVGVGPKQTRGEPTGGEPTATELTGTEPMGTAGTTLPAAIEIKRFYVAPAWHGRGVAQELMGACLREAPAGVPVWLGVFASNARAIAFYAKCGFRVVGEMTFVMGEDHQRDFVMLWSGPAPAD
jgi:ribosomal protein S18 acetylase RimI-like enzyme